MGGNDLNLRAQALSVQQSFEDAISLEVGNGNDSYTIISDTIDFIQNIVKSFNAHEEVYNNAVFIIGPTGAGKSTLMNYIAGKELFFNLYNDQPGIHPLNNDAIAYVGKGDGSTTIVPNVWQADIESLLGTTFIDCAGDFDSTGAIMEVINSKIKSVIAQNVKHAKILIVNSQDSLSPSGGYGYMFKKGLENSAQFLNDINHFQDSICLVASHAGRMDKTSEIVESYLRKIVEDPNIESYRPVLENILNNHLFATFSKFSDEIGEGELYTPPLWNRDQRDTIIELINSISFQPVPRGLFSDSSSPDVREQMGKAFKIIRDKAVTTITSSLEDALSSNINIFAGVLKPFSSFLKQIMSLNVITGLEQYVECLNSYGYLKLCINKDEIIQLNNELNFLASFLAISENQKSEQAYVTNWGSLIGAGRILQDIYDEVILFSNSGQEQFSNFKTGKKVLAVGCSAQHSNTLKQLRYSLYNKYKEKHDIESSRHDMSSKYWNEKEVEEFDRMEEQSYEVEQKYIDYHKIKVKKTIEVPYTETEYYTQKSLSDGKTAFFTFGTFGAGPLIKGLLTGEPAWCDTEIRSREVTKYKKVEIEEEVLKPFDNFRMVKQNEKVPLYKTVCKPEFNEAEYDNDLKSCNKSIEELIKQMEENLQGFRNENNSISINLSPETYEKINKKIKEYKALDHSEYDEFMELLKDLNEQWKDMEYEAYFAQNLDAVFDVSIIGGI